MKAKEEGKVGSGSVTFAPPPNFKPPEPKTFGVRPDKTGDIFGASLALFFRLGTGVFVDGYANFLSLNLLNALQIHYDIIYEVHTSARSNKFCKKDI